MCILKLEVTHGECVRAHQGKKLVLCEKTYRNLNWGLGNQRLRTRPEVVGKGKSFIEIFKKLSGRKDG